jgi:hypothetical protein
MSISMKSKPTISSQPLAAMSRVTGLIGAATEHFEMGDYHRFAAWPKPPNAEHACRTRAHA